MQFHLVRNQKVAQQNATAVVRRDGKILQKQNQEIIQKNVDLRTHIAQREGLIHYLPEFIKNWMGSLDNTPPGELIHPSDSEFDNESYSGGDGDGDDSSLYLPFLSETIER